MAIASSADFRAAARRRLPPFLFHYIDGGAYGETTLRRNVEDLAEIALRQRVLKDVSSLSLDIDLFGRRQSLPVALGPVGLSGMYARRGEVAAARAANAHDIPFCLSTLGICSLAEVARGTGAPFWFQLYVLRDRGYTREMIAAARAAGCSALVFTVDLAVPGTRYRDAHSGMSGRFSTTRRLWQALSHPRWAWDVGLRGRPHSLGTVARDPSRSGLGDYVGWIGAEYRSLDRLEGPRIPAPRMGGAFDPQGHSRPRGRAGSGRARRRRTRRLESWRTPARRGQLDGAGAARHRRRGRRRPGRARRRRRAQRPRRAQDARARRPGRCCSAAPGPLRWRRAAAPASTRC